MPVSVSAERQRIRAGLAQAHASADGYPVDGPTLAHWCYAAAAHATRALKRTTDDERDALAAMVAERVVSAHGPSPERARVGREYLRTIASRIVVEDGPAGREWRDLASGYATRSQRDSGAQPMIVPLPDETASIESADPLSRAILEASARSGEPCGPVPADAVELADALADSLTIAQTPAEDRALRVALLRAGMEAKGREAAPLARIAADTGLSLVTVKRDSAKGAAILRERVPARQLAAAVAYLAPRMGAVTPADPTRPNIGADSLAAMRAVDACRPVAAKRAMLAGQGAQVFPRVDRLQGECDHAHRVPAPFRLYPVPNRIGRRMALTGASYCKRTRSGW